MAQQIADGAEWRSFSFEVYCEGVPQSMCVDSFVDAGFRGEPWQQVPHVALVDGGASERAEDGRRSRGFEPGSDVHPALDESGCSWIQADDSSFVAFAVLDHDGSLFDLEVFGLEGESLTDT